MSNYNDHYRGSQAPPRPRYYDDDSDYDEHTGTRYPAGSGRGYGDDNASSAYDRASSRTVPADRPFRDREDTYRSERERGGEREREDAVVERRQRRRDDERSEVSQRRDRGRDRSRSDSRSRSRSRSRDGFKEKLEGAFDTSGRGLGVGIAGALAGALAGRQLGKGKHAERDMIIGALVGGLGANAAEQGLRGHKERKERRDEGRIEERWDGRRDDGGRSRSRG